MADLPPIIETMENRWMRAWVQRDARSLKVLTARNFMLLMGSKKPVILDALDVLSLTEHRHTPHSS